MTGTRALTPSFTLITTELPHMLKDVIKPDTPWTLGELPDGWEWLAFTFKDQQEIGLSEAEIETMLRTSDAVAKHAYSRMRLNASHRWAQHTPNEVALIVRECQLGVHSTRAGHWLWIRPPCFGTRKTGHSCHGH
jgi:hypothetical protein